VVLKVLPEDLSSIESGNAVQRHDPIFPASVRWILEEPDSIEILKLGEDTTVRYADDEKEGEEIKEPGPIGMDDPGLFHEHRVRGSTLVPNSSRRRAVGQALISANRNNLGGSMCFDAHVGIRAIRNDQKVEMLICFWCGNVLVIGPDNLQQMYPIGRSAEKLLRRELWRGGVGWLFFWRRWLP
jgi:hypothetical protein